MEMFLKRSFKLMLKFDIYFRSIEVIGVDTGAAGAAFAAPIISAGAVCRTI